MSERETLRFTGDSQDFTHDELATIKKRLKRVTDHSDDIGVILATQANDFKNNNLYKKGWDKAEKLYNKKTDLHSSFSFLGSFFGSLPNEVHIAVICYTLEDPAVYKDFNEKTRKLTESDNLSSYHYTSYFKLLQMAIVTLSEDSKFTNGASTLYRGLRGEFTFQIGKSVAFQHYVSTSTNLAVAEHFADNYVLEFRGIAKEESLRLRFHSEYPKEEEVLVSPFVGYTVKSKEKKSKGWFSSYTLVVLEKTGNGSCNIV